MKEREKEDRNEMEYIIIQFVAFIIASKLSICLYDSRSFAMLNWTTTMEWNEMKKRLSWFEIHSHSIYLCVSYKYVAVVGGGGAVCREYCKVFVQDPRVKCQIEHHLFSHVHVAHCLPCHQRHSMQTRHRNWMVKMLDQIFVCLHPASSKLCNGNALLAFVK